MVVNGVTITREAHDKAAAIFGKVPSTIDSLAEQNKFLHLCVKIQLKLNEINNIKIED